MAEGGIPQSSNRFFARSDFIPDFDFIQLDVVMKEIQERGKSVKHIALRRLWQIIIENLFGGDDIIIKLHQWMVLNPEEKLNLQANRNTYDKIDQLLHLMYEKDEQAIESFCLALKSDGRNNIIVDLLTQLNQKFSNVVESFSKDTEAHSTYVFAFRVISTADGLDTLLLPLLKQHMNEISNNILNGNANILDIVKGSIQISIDACDKWQLIEIMKMMDRDIIRYKLQKWVKQHTDLQEISVNVQIDSGTRAILQQQVIPQDIEVISSKPNNFYMSSISQYTPTGQPINILLLGKTGVGKSYLGNTLLNRPKLFTVHPGSASGTRNAERQTLLVQGRQITVVDTPGSMDTKDKESAIDEICGAIAHCPQGFDAIAIVLRYGSRLTAEEREAAHQFHAFFGEEVERYSFLVFTHGSQYRGDMDDENKQYDFKPFIGKHEISSQEDSFGPLLRKYQNGWILIENREKDELRKNRQRNEFIGIVDDIRFKSKFQRYTNVIFHAARQKKEELEKQNMREDEQHKTIVEWLKHQFKHIFDQCFPEDATVILSPGDPVPISNIAVGDRVLSVDKTGKMCYKKVYMLGHSDGNGLMRSVTVTTKSCKLTASSGHYITVNKIHGRKPLKYTKLMRHVKVGDMVMIINTQTNCLMEEEVLAVDKHFSKGMYNPFTTSGTIVVNGVVATCYEENCAPRKAHALMGIVRALYSISPQAVNGINTVQIHGTPAWVHGPLNIMKRFRPKKKHFLD